MPEQAEDRDREAPPDTSNQATEPATDPIPEGADPGPPTMDYFEKEGKPPSESR